MKQFLLVIGLLFCHMMAFADPIDRGIAYQGLITQANGTPFQNSGVIFKLQLISSGSEGCVLYDEEQTVDMSNSGGVFNLTIGNGNSSYAGNQNPFPTIPFSFLFDNTVNQSGLTCARGSTYTPSLSSLRKLRASFYDGSSWTNLSDMLITAAPFAEHAMKLQGLGASSFIQVNSTTAALTQPNIESVFNSQASVTELAALIAGQSTQYVTTGGSTPVTFSFPPVSATAPTASNQLTNKGYTDGTIAGETADSALQSLSSGDAGKDLVWNGTQWTAQSAPVSGINVLTGDVTASGTGSVVATISSGAVTDSKVASGINASKISTGFLSTSVIPGLAASQITTGIFPMTRGGTGVSGFSGINQIVATDSITGTTLTQVSCSIGQTISFGVTGYTCVAPSVGTVTSISAGNGLMGGTITSSGTLAVDTSVVALLTDSRFTNSRPPNGSASGDLSGSYPAPTVAKIQGIAVKTGTPVANQVLEYNSTNSDWEATTLPVGNNGTIISVSAAPPLSVATPNTTPALSISQASTSVNGYLSSTDWTTFNGKVSTTDSRLAPTPTVGSALSMIRINSTGTAYEARTPVQIVSDLNLSASFDASGAAASAQAASLQKTSNLSDLASPSTARTNLGLGSAAVLTAGTAANNVVQLSAVSKLPAVDGSALTNLNAANILPTTAVPVTSGGTGLTGVTPTNGQILIGNGTGFTLATLSQGSNIIITNTAGVITISAALAGKPTGEVFMTATPTCPSGSIKADGSTFAFNGTCGSGTCQNLCNAIQGIYGSTSLFVNSTAYSAFVTSGVCTAGSFKVPNHSGVFPRGAGSQVIGGVTYSATQGSTQSDQMQGHVHILAMDIGTLANGSSTVSASFNHTLALGGTGLNGTFSPQGPTADAVNGTPRTGAESRPANVADLFCIAFY